MEVYIPKSGLLRHIYSLIYSLKNSKIRLMFVRRIELCSDCIQLLHGKFSLLVSQMNVGIVGKSRISVTENNRNNLDVHTFKEKQTGKGVAQCVDSTAVFDTCTLAYPFIGVDKRIYADRLLTTKSIESVY